MDIRLGRTRSGDSTSDWGWAGVAPTLCAISCGADGIGAPDAVKGIRVCRQGIRDYGRLRIVERTDPRGYRYYWFGLAPTIETPGHVTDLEVVADGYVSVTPLFLDLTHEAGLDRLAERFEAAK